MIETDPTTNHAPSGETAWFLARVSELTLDGSDGSTAMVERSAPSAGLMTPLHVRDEDEAYRVIAGRVTFFVGHEAVLAGEGDVVVAPAGRARTLRIESDGARWLVLTRVRSLPAYEDFGRALAVPAGSTWASSDEAAALAALASANGIEVLGPPGVLPA